MIEKTFNCPHCGTKRITGEFIIGARFYNDRTNYLSAVWVCRNPSCRLPTAMFLSTRVRQSEIDEDGIIYNDTNTGISYSLVKFWPEQPHAKASQDLPPDVRRCMLDAEDALISAAPRIARGAFRTVLDVATKEIVQQNPSCLDGSNPDKLNLNSRIDKLAKHHLLTVSLKEWAHGVRGITNDDVHGPEPVEKEEAEEIAEITRMILKYLYELPASVERMRIAAQAKRDAAKAS